MSVLVTKAAVDRDGYRVPKLFYTSAREGFEDFLKNLPERPVPLDGVLLPAFIGWSPREGSGVFDPIRDTRDAASALLHVVGSEFERWRSIYNLGSRDPYPLLQIAQCVADVANRYGVHDVQIDVAGESGSSGTVMDSSLFYDDFGWVPKCGLESTVQAHFEAALAASLCRSS